MPSIEHRTKEPVRGSLRRLIVLYVTPANRGLESGTVMGKPGSCFGIGLSTHLGADF